MVIAETSRLVLRHIGLDDVEALAPILADPEVMRFSVGGPKTTAETEESIRRFMDSYRRHEFGRWAVVHGSTGDLIGFCGLGFEELEGRPEVELGYRLGRAWWGQGLATEAAAAARNHGFKKLGLRRLVAIIEPENAASIRVAEKVGMAPERDAAFHGVPVRLYAMDNPKPA